ncbi:ATP-binding protein [Streptomyces sp. P1-3]|uniref:ATP-binding protein n=1 Tax=Streptomyces sp. P1-3 TaxID=3421658 RepID=UPI003D367CBC
MPETETANIPPLFRFSAPNHPTSPRVCRDAIAALLHAKGEAEELTETARLLVSEAVSNVHRHATATRMIHITVLAQAGAALITVKDNEPSRHPLPRQATAGDEAGRGLVLMQRLAYKWGVRLLGSPEPTRKQIWFEVRAPQADLAPEKDE